MLLIDDKVKKIFAGALIAGSIGLMVYFLPKTKNAIGSGILSKIKKKQKKAASILKKKIVSKKAAYPKHDSKKKTKKK